MSYLTGLIENVVMTCECIEFKLRDQSGEVTDLHYMKCNYLDVFQISSESKFYVTCLTKRSEVLKVLI